MKKFLIILCSCILCMFNTYSQNITIPDNFFKQKLIEAGVDTNGDTEISFTEAEAIDSLDISNTDDPTMPAFEHIANLTGLEAFTNLIYLDCRRHEIIGYDFSANSKLRYLDCSFNSMTSIDITNLGDLEDFNIQFNDFTQIDISQNIQLLRFELSLNNLTQLDVSKNINLESLSFLGNTLSELNLTQNIKLKKLVVSGAQNTITQIDLSKCTELEDLTISYSDIANLDISQNKKLTRLSLHFNDNLSKICVWELPLPLNIEVLSYNTLPFTVCNSAVDSVYNLIAGDWYKTLECNGFTGKCTKVYSSIISTIERIPGTDSIRWINKYNGVVINSTKYKIVFENSYLFHQNRWKLTGGMTNTLINVYNSNLSCSLEAYDGGGASFSRTKNIQLDVSKNEVTLSKDESSNSVIDVTSNTTWEVSSDQLWATISTNSGSNNGTFTITASANTGDARTAIITISGDGATTQTIIVTQEAEIKTLSVSSNSVALPKDEGSNTTINVTSNTTWEVSSDQLWATATPNSGSNNGTFTITVTENTSSARTATITVSGVGVSSQIILVNQEELQTISNISTIGKNKNVITPNPANTYFTIKDKNNAKIEIYNIIGELVLQTEISKNDHISTRSMNSGMYIVKIISDSGMTIERLIITK